MDGVINLLSQDANIDAIIQDSNFNGVILLAAKNQVLFSKGYGMANIEYSILNTPKIKFRLGSITKTFTATAIMQLIESNTICINDSIAKYLTYPNGDKVTIFHLLTHTAGIPNLTEFPDFFDWVMKYSPVEKTIEHFKSKPLDFSPGYKYKYSNSGYILLSYIIELVTGNSYENYLKENIFSPLKMHNSGFDKNETIINNRAAGYHIQDGNLINAPFINMSNPSGAASLYSTVEDLYLFDQALYTNKLLNRNSITMMYEPYKENYGLGWIIENKFGRRLINHGGGIHGFSANFLRYVDDLTTVIILSNVFYPKEKINRLSHDLSRIIFENL